jgi:hypothetical protein
MSTTGGMSDFSLLEETLRRDVSGQPRQQASRMLNLPA